MYKKIGVSGYGATVAIPHGGGPRPGSSVTDELLEQGMSQAVLLGGMLTHGRSNPRYNTVSKAIMELNGQHRYCCETSARIHPN